MKTTRETKKEKILKTATLLFAEKGFKETPMSELAKRTGIAEGTIFYHFKTKEDIFLAILEMIQQGIVSEFNRYMEENHFENGMQMMDGIIDFYLNFAASHETWFLILTRQYPYELSRVNPACRNNLEAIYNCLIDIFEKAILTGQADGSIGQMPARKTAFILFSMVNGLMWYKINGLYDGAALFNELVVSYHKILKRDARNE